MGNSKRFFQNPKSVTSKNKWNQQQSKTFTASIILKLNEKFFEFEGKNLVELTKEFKLKKLHNLLEKTKPVKISRQIESIEIKKLKELEKKAQNSNFPPLRSLTCYWKLDYTNFEGNLDSLVKEFNELLEVVFVYKERKPFDPLIDISDDNFGGQQGYLTAAPDGIDAIWAWSQGYEGNGVGFIDLEQGWIPTHEDLAAANPSLVFNDNRHGVGTYVGNHGTAVLGQIIGVDNTQGIVGIAPSVDFVRMVSHFDASTNTFNVPNAIIAAIMNMNAGDLLLLEVAYGDGPELLAESEMADFDAIRLAAANGIIVVEAGGNGDSSGNPNDLDTWTDSSSNFRLNRTHADFQDSGAIVVAAATSTTPHNRMSWSNFGSRIDCYSWGQNIVTAGYGDLAGNSTANRNDDYTSTFGGTSGASPIISGAALFLQGIYKETAGTTLSPLQMRSILSNPNTGTTQGASVSGNIGVMPDLKDIIENTLEVTPDVYLRDNIGDTGVVPTTGSISASPDIIVRSNPVPNAISQFGEGSGNENSNSLSSGVDSTQDNYVYVRLKNRGFTEATNTTVKVYWSEVSTLVTPNLWNLIGTTNPITVPVGDTLVVTDPLIWNENDIPSPGHYCFVGMANHPQDGLPPLPSATNFDWDDFRAFVKNNNNATWRNFNVEPVDPVDPNFKLNFNIVGSPDKVRRFDFEIVRQLPKKTRLVIQVPFNLFKLLNLKGIKTKVIEKENAVQVLLPNLRSFCLSDVPLSKERYKCKFFLEGDESISRGMHHLFIKQTFEGEEVGRITWAFKTLN